MNENAQVLLRFRYGDLKHILDVIEDRLDVLSDNMHDASDPEYAALVRIRNGILTASPLEDE